MLCSEELNSGGWCEVENTTENNSEKAHTIPTNKIEQTRKQFGIVEWALYNENENTER